MAVEFTATLEQILKDTSPQLPGAIRSVAMRELRLALREFFEKSYAWTKLLIDIDAPAGETPILLDDGDSEAQIVGTLYVTFSGNTMTPLPDRPPRSVTAELPQFWYITSNPEEIVLFPYLPAQQLATVTARVALMPSDTTTTLPRQVMLKFYDAIVDGFLARMYVHPSKPYSAPALAQRHRQKFVQSIGFYAAQRKQGFNAAPNWLFPAGWHTRRVN